MVELDGTQLVVLRVPKKIHFKKLNNNVLSKIQDQFTQDDPQNWLWADLGLNYFLYVSLQKEVTDCSWTRGKLKVQGVADIYVLCSHELQPFVHE